MTIYIVLMMNYTVAQTLSLAHFKRRFGIQRVTFKQIVKALKPEWSITPKPGTQPKLGLADRVLVALEYGREYRTDTVRLGVWVGTCGGAGSGDCGIDGMWADGNVLIAMQRERMMTALSVVKLLRLPLVLPLNDRCQPCPVGLQSMGKAPFQPSAFSPLTPDSRTPCPQS